MSACLVKRWYLVQKLCYCFVLSFALPELPLRQLHNFPVRRILQSEDVYSNFALVMLHVAWEMSCCCDSLLNVKVAFIITAPTKSLCHKSMCYHVMLPYFDFCGLYKCLQHIGIKG